MIVVCDGQFLTPDQLREQHDIGYAARTHYELSGSRRTDLFNRVNPDYLLRGSFVFITSFSLLNNLDYIQVFSHSGR